jgi:hypothetical protein
MAQREFSLEFKRVFNVAQWKCSPSGDAKLHRGGWHGELRAHIGDFTPNLR